MKEKASDIYDTAQRLALCSFFSGILLGICEWKL